MVGCTCGTHYVCRECSKQACNKERTSAPSNPRFTAMLDWMRDTCAKKQADYANDDPYSNFAFSGMLGAMFTRPIDVAFATLIGVKLARLSELSKSGRVSNNESVQDTRGDLANYAALWASYYWPKEE